MKLPDEVMKALYNIGLTYPPERVIETIVRDCAEEAADAFLKNIPVTGRVVRDAILARYGLGE